MRVSLIFLSSSHQQPKCHLTQSQSAAKVRSKTVSLTVSVGARPQISQYRKGIVGTPNRTSFSTQEPRSDPLRS